MIEYGCGDGNQLRLADYPSYLGFDVSGKAVSLCAEIFAGDPAKAFKLTTDYDGERADATLSLDVIYHLVEDEVFEAYMRRLFDSADRYVIIYSSNQTTQVPGQAVHVRHRRFTDWVDRHTPDWKLRTHIPNRYPFKDDTATGSFADFYIYERP